MLARIDGAEALYHRRRARRAALDVTGILLANLDDPATAGRLDRLPPDRRAPVQRFMASRLRPPRPGRDFIDAIAEALFRASRRWSSPPKT